MPDISDLTYFTVVRTVSPVPTGALTADVTFEAQVTRGLALQADLSDDVIEILARPVHARIVDGVLMKDGTPGVELLSAAEVAIDGGFSYTATFKNVRVDGVQVATRDAFKDLTFEALDAAGIFDLKDAAPIVASTAVPMARGPVGPVGVDGVQPSTDGLSAEFTRGTGPSKTVVGSVPFAPASVDSLLQATTVGKAVAKAANGDAALTAQGVTTVGKSVAKAADAAAARLAVGLNAVNNTADADKPVSTAQAAALASQVTVKKGDPWRSVVFAAPAANDIPTVTINAASQISGGTTISPTTDYFGDTHFRYDGAPSVETGTGGVQPPSSSTKGIVYELSAETVLSSMSTVEFAFSTRPTVTTLAVRVIVDDVWVNTYALQFSGLTVNTMYYLKLTFPTARPRRVKVEAAGMYRFGGVIVPSGGNATRPPGEVVKRAVINWDSYGAGAGGNTTTDPTTNGSTKIETAPHYVARMLECDSVINVSVGGTGWVNNGGAGKSTFGERVPEILACNPHIVLLGGSINDTASSATYDQVYAAVTAVLAQLEGVPVVVLTGPERDTAASATYATYNNAIRDAAAQYKRIFVDTLDTIKGSLYNAADGVHPSAYAHFAVLAAKLYDGISRVALDQRVAAEVAARVSTDLTLTASPSSVANTGASVTLTATQSVQRAGVVDFFANGVLLNTSTVSSGVAAYTTSSLAAGSYTLSARFRPTNPLQVKSAFSNTLAYSITSNLGFVDHFAVDGALTSTENGKAYAALGTVTGTASGGSAGLTTSGGTAYLVADAGTPNGTFSVKWVGGSSITAAQIALRASSNSNLLRLRITGGNLVLQQVVSNTSTDLASVTGGTWANGDTISVILNGDLITVQKNGTNITGLVNISCSQWNTLTKFGIGHATGTNIVLFDDLQFVA
ncbi:hypothetical protein FK535_09160 [Mycolicibacterium sp. 018/SC-01/001]|uniref:SGNH/GDSL hydrolase family protein n=1 Tax=Mycolicibacterium sp. 018/SC-01/001 TaxID=2592069 RepID=UPI00117E2A88|nr:SGNH/GDSL hydrolase family protein [Mycolicibacterium sp. 018/SC-01/001]TRW85554.1 hypothetical protein FK535_09160 [Mycolicibacterium sp. 018/SC-01/001]